MTSQKGAISVLVFLALIGFLLSVIFSMRGDMAELNPLLNIPTAYHFLLFAFLIPMFASVLTVLIFPRIIAPLFMRTKKVFMRGHKDRYIVMPERQLSLRKWFSRAFLTALLVLGILSVVINVIDPQIMMSPKEITEFPLDGISEEFFKYTPPVIITLTGLIAPIAVGFWAVSWILEDAGLVHYQFSDDDSPLFEVEPVYLRLKGYLKGYAGLSSILFFISMILIFYSVPAVLETAIFTTFIPMFSILQTIPAYLVYTRLDPGYLRNNVKEMKQLTEASFDAN